MTSYQHSTPGDFSDEKSCSIATVLGLKEISANNNDPPAVNKRRTSRSMATVVLALFVLLLASFSFFSSPTFSRSTNNYNLRGIENSSLDAIMMHATGDSLSYAKLSKPEPDYKGEGSYHAEKCKNGRNGKCYEEEQERVDNYWEEFGLKMKVFWTMIQNRLSSNSTVCFQGRCFHATEQKNDGESQAKKRDPSGDRKKTDEKFKLEEISPQEAIEIQQGATEENHVE